MTENCDCGGYERESDGQVIHMGWCRASDVEWPPRFN